MIIQRRVNSADTGVVDTLTVLGIDILVGRIPGREAAEFLSGFHIQNVYHIAGGSGHRYLGAIRRQGHMVRAIAIHQELPGDLTADHVDGHHIRIAGPGNDQQTTVRRTVHIVHILVIAFADQYANALEKQQIQRIEGNFLLSCRLIRDTADTAKALIGLGIDDIDHAFPVVAHKDYPPRAIFSLFRHLLGHLIRGVLLWWRLTLGLIDIGSSRRCGITAAPATATQ